MTKAQARREYVALPTTASPQDFLKGHGNWGLTESQNEMAYKLATIICTTRCRHCGAPKDVGRPCAYCRPTR